VQAHKVDQTLVFKSWEDLVNASEETFNAIGKRLADAVIVAVQDNLHLKVATAFARQGYHILCEKPMATTLEECIAMEQEIKKANVIFGMGHGEFPVL
jgi:predicted dehydrogenase